MTRRMVATFCFALMACGSSTPKPAATTIGPDGGVVFGPGGAALGVPAGLLAGELTLKVEVVSPPAIPLPDGVVPRGEVYRMSGSSPIRPPDPQDGLVVGLPVPAGLDPATLWVALAVLPGEDTLASDWTFLRGFHDGERNLLLARLGGLAQAGATLRLVEEVDPPPIGARAEVLLPRAAGGLAGPREAAAAGPWLDAIELVEVPPRPLAGARAFFQPLLDQALARYRASGFAPFDLETVETQPTLVPPSVRGPPAPRYRVEVRAMSKVAPGKRLAVTCDRNAEGSIDGTYFTDTRVLRLCAPRTAAELADPAKVRALTQVVFHELFHAVQRGSLGEPPPEAAKYFKEGTATLAGAWGPRADDEVVLNPDSNDTRLVDEPLTQVDGQAPYTSQEFWRSLALPRQLTFQELVRPFLEKGDVSPAKVDEVLGASPFGSTLDKEYRRWARAQSADPGSCIRAVGHPVALASVSIEEAGVSGLPPAPLALTVPALTSTVLQLAASNRTSRAAGLDLTFTGDWATPAADGGSPVLVIEALLRADGSMTCATTPDVPFAGGVHRVSLPASSEMMVYVMGVNGRHDGTLAGQVALSGARLHLDRVEGPSSLAFDTQGTYQLFWSGTPVFPVTIHTRVTACSLNVCNAPGDIPVAQLANPQPFPLRCFTVEGTPTAGAFTLEATMTDAAGLESNAISVTVSCVNSPN